MRIRLGTHYRNASGAEIRPGEYEAADPRLHGLAGYLIQTEQATVVEEPVPLEAEADLDPDADEDEDDSQTDAADDADYQAMTKGQLLNIAKAGGIELSDRLGKQAIIDALIAHGKK